MNKILIISYYFPPSNDIAARRFGTMVAYLESMGVRVYVLTTNSDGSIPVRIPEERIVRIGDNRQRSANIDDLASENLPKLVELLRRPARKSGFYFWSIDRSVITWYKLVRDNISYLDTRIEHPDLILTSFGPAACLWLGKLLSKHYCRPWISDIRDLGAQRCDERSLIARYIDLLVEKRLLSSVSAITTVSETLNELLTKRYNKPGLVVYNGWDKALNTASSLNKANNYNYIYYAGRFYPEQMPAVKMFLDSIKVFPSINILIRSLGPTQLNNEISAYANEIGLCDRVKITPPCDQSTVNNEAEASLANLVFAELSCRTFWTKGTLTGKLFELLVRRPPVIAVGRPDSEIADVLNYTQKGKLCSTQDEIVQLLKDIIDKRINYEGEYTAINSFSREQQAFKLYDFVNRLQLIN